MLRKKDCFHQCRKTYKINWCPINNIPGINFGICSFITFTKTIVDKKYKLRKATLRQHGGEPWRSLSNLSPDSTFQICFFSPRFSGYIHNVLFHEIFQTHFNNSCLNVGFFFFLNWWKSSSEYFGGLREAVLCIGVICFSFWKDGADPTPHPFIFPLLPPPPSLPLALLVLEDETADCWEAGGVTFLCARSVSEVFCIIKK